MLFSKNVKSIGITGIALCFLLLSACEVPDSPTGLPQPEPNLNTQGPICYQEIECVIETTRDNTLRKEAQETINALLLSDQPEYTRICQAKADELTENLMQCRKRKVGQTQ